MTTEPRHYPRNHAPCSFCLGLTGTSVHNYKRAYVVRENTIVDGAMDKWRPRTDVSARNGVVPERAEDWEENSRKTCPSRYK